MLNSNCDSGQRRSTHLVLYSYWLKSELWPVTKKKPRPALHRSCSTIRHGAPAAESVLPISGNTFPPVRPVPAGRCQISSGLHAGAARWLPRPRDSYRCLANYPVQARLYAISSEEGRIFSRQLDRRLSRFHQPVNRHKMKPSWRRAAAGEVTEKIPQNRSVVPARE